MSAATTQQPPPQPNDGPGMHDLVIADLRSRWADYGLSDELVEAMTERRDFGLESYGVPLQAGNGRDPLVDALQESLDQVAYLKQSAVEGTHDPFGTIEQLYEFEVLQACRLLAAIKHRDFLRRAESSV